jgi:ribosome biogenesis ATPase
MVLLVAERHCLRMLWPGYDLHIRILMLQELGLPFISLSAPTIVSGMSGESEKKVRDIFEEAKQNAPCLMFIDEIDAVTQKRETAQREMERRIVAQLLTCMDGIIKVPA